MPRDRRVRVRGRRCILQMLVSYITWMVGLLGWLFGIDVDSIDIVMDEE